MDMKKVSEVEQFERRLEAAVDCLCETKGSCLTISWLQRALKVLQAAQLDLRKLVQESVRGDEEWLKGCLSGLEDVLHVCSTLQRSIVDIGHYAMFVELALQAVDKEQYSRARHLLGCCIDDQQVHVSVSDHREVSRLGLQKARLETCMKVLLGMAEQLQDPKHFAPAPLGSAMFALRVMSIFVLLVLTKCLAIKPSPVPPASAKKTTLAISAAASAAVNGCEPLWWPSVGRLHLKIKGEMVRAEGAFALLHELDEVDGHARELYHRLGSSEEWDDATAEVTDRLRRCVVDVQAGLPLVEREIHEISKVVSSARTTAFSNLPIKTIAKQSD